MSSPRASLADLPSLSFGVELMDADSRRAMSALVRSPRRAGLYVISSPSLFLAEQAAELLGRAWLGEAADSELVVASPEGEWSVADVMTRVVHPAQVVSPRGRVVVMQSAAPSARAVHDRLLLLTEEPPEGVTIVLCAREKADVPVTLLGRALAAVDVLPAPPGQLEEALVLRGADRVRARRAGDRAGSIVPLVWAAGMSDDVLTAVETVFDLAAWRADMLDELADGLRVCVEAVGMPGREADLVGEVCRLMRAAARCQIADMPVEVPGWREPYARLGRVRELARFGSPLVSIVAWVTISWGFFRDLRAVPAR